MSLDQIYARVVADSISHEGIRLTTVECRIHRFVLAEKNTHRVFSRNSASSRAIPLHKQIEKVLETPAIPVVWAAEQKGMQGGDEIASPYDAEQVWLAAGAQAASFAETLGAMNVHKSLANRLLEPFLMHTVLITSTAWENYLRLRLDRHAQPEIRVSAEHIRDALDASEPTFLQPGMWHLPYITRDSISEAEEYLLESWGQGGYGSPHVTKTLVMMSSAKAARTSYENANGDKGVRDELRLYESLTHNGHASPLEHVATPAGENMQEVDVRSRFEPERVHRLVLPIYGNFLGWHQHRADVEAERAYQAFS